MLAVTLYCLVAIVVAFLTLRYKCPTKATGVDVGACLAVGMWWPLALFVAIPCYTFKGMAKLYNKFYS